MPCKRNGQGARLTLQCARECPCSAVLRSAIEKSSRKLTRVWRMQGKSKCLGNKSLYWEVKTEFVPSILHKKGRKTMCLMLLPPPCPRLNASLGWSCHWLGRNDISSWKITQDRNVTQVPAGSEGLEDSSSGMKWIPLTLLHLVLVRDSPGGLVW